MSDRIEKSIGLKAPIERVWRALTDQNEFGEWFQVKLNDPFVPGETTSGRLIYPGYEGLPWEVMVVDMEKPRYLSFKWHPYAVDPNIDYSQEEPTLVEFRLEPTSNGTRLTITESGFNGVPHHRMPEAMRQNEGGWEEQMKNIKAYVEQ